MNPMENDPSFDPRIAQLLALKRYETPPPGFPDYLRGRVMRAIAAERERAARPWWTRFFEEVTWQRGMWAVNTLAFAGVAFLAAATFQVAHSVANEDVEGQVYAALPLPVREPATLDEEALVASNDLHSSYRLLPSSGVSAPVTATFNLPSTPAPRTDSVPKWLFNTPSISNPQFILASDRDQK
jgi:hypothetical protein